MNVSFIQRCVKWLTNSIIEEYIKDSNSISDSLKRKIDIFSEKTRAELDWENITSTEALQLGFVLWNKTDTYEQWLIPTYLYPCIPMGLELIDTEGNIFSFDTTKYTTSTFFGWQRYGILIPTNENLENVPCHQTAMNTAVNFKENNTYDG